MQLPVAQQYFKVTSVYEVTFQASQINCTASVFMVLRNHLLIAHVILKESMLYYV